MIYFFDLFLVGLVVGLAGVASNPAPYFAALGLVVAAGVGCGMLMGHGGGFLSLLLFLIYMGGMLVVFAYSAALAADFFPETWGVGQVKVYMMVYLGGVGVVAWQFWGTWYSDYRVIDEFKEFFVLRGDASGVALMYSFGGLLMTCAWVLLLCLFVVLELTRGLDRGTLRAV